jgi:hypothetical protein
VSNLIVDLKGNTATSESYWTFLISNGQTNGIPNPPSVLLMGRYEDKLVKQNDQWLFSKRIITDLSMPRPASMATPAKK